MIAKAVEMGLSPEDAHTLAVQSMRGQQHWPKKITLPFCVSR